MLRFRIFLAVILFAISAYTVPVIVEHGIDLLPIFFGDIGSMGWPGQFNLDFLGMLLLSAFWTAWRNEFSGVGLVLSVFAFFFGAPFLASYFLYLSVETKGNPKQMLMGNRQ
jgi:hypothetical protein